MPTSRSNNTIIAVTMGDPGGIGPEVILKSFAAEALQRHLTQQSDSNVFFVYIGSRAVLERQQTLLGAHVPLVSVDAVSEDTLSSRCLNVYDCTRYDPQAAVYENAYVVGDIAEANAHMSLCAVKEAARLAKAGIVHAVVTAPINKEACQLVEDGFTGHTELLAQIDGAPAHAMMLCGGPLRVVLVTTHVPLVQVSERLSVAGIAAKIELTHAYLKKYFHLETPRIGIAGLNPHAGEGGKIGGEERDIILPAIQAVRDKGINVEGLYPADVIFHKAYHGGLDAVVAMYHDQGLAPLKMIAFESGINTTLGLSYIRTSPDHGTAFDIAYQHKAHHDSMANAIIYAIERLQA